MGTRLRPYTFVVPKPLIPIGTKPIVELLLENLAGQGISDAYLAVGYHAELLQAYLGDGSRVGLPLRYYRERERLGTAGPIRMVRDEFELRQPLLALNADILTRVDFRRLFAFHEERQACLTVGVRIYRQTIPFGRLSVDDAARVVAIEEKPQLAFPVSAGIYVLEERAVDRIPPGRFFDMPDLVTALIEAGELVVAFEITEPWTAIEDAADWQRVMDATDPGKDPE